jgi:branched-chain amino acid transport system substrate-binding protein
MLAHPRNAGPSVMPLLRRLAPCLAAIASLALPITQAQAADKPIRVGVLNDQSGVYSDFQGVGSVVAAQMAVEDFGGKAAGRAIEVISADHQNKPDIGATTARRWIDVDGVDVIADVPNSAIALAVNGIVRERNKVFLASGAGTTELTGAQCSPNTVHWTYDTWALAHSTAKSLVAQGGRSWFFLTSDYAFGHDLERNAAATVKAEGGTVVGGVRHPLDTSDVSSFILQAQGSGADVIGLANAGGDTTTFVKQAAEFGVMAGQQKIAAMIFSPNNVHALGLETTQGLISASPFYWDLNDGTRDWSRRFAERHPKHNMPNDMQAGVYSAVLHYLKAVEKTGQTEDGAAVVKAMKEMPSEDPLFGKGRVREDGRAIHPIYLYETKKPTESKEPWDYFEVIDTVPGEEAFRPMAEGKCPLIG